jgi:hypothetical protein
LPFAFGIDSTAIEVTKRVVPERPQELCDVLLSGSSRIGQTVMFVGIDGRGTGLVGISVGTNALRLRGV